MTVVLLTVPLSNIFVLVGFEQGRKKLYKGLGSTLSGVLSSAYETRRKVSLIAQSQADAMLCVCLCLRRRKKKKKKGQRKDNQSGLFVARWLLVVVSTVIFCFGCER